MTRNASVFLILTAIMLTGLGLAGGCGKKGPPLPPLNKGNLIAAPAGLGYTLDERLNGSRITLTWAHAVDPENAKIPPEGFEIFVATKDAAGCEGCPFIFKSAGIVPMPKMEFTYDLGPDLKYYFRIQAMGKNDVRSKFSKTLNIDKK